MLTCALIYTVAPSMCPYLMAKIVLQNMTHPCQTLPPPVDAINDRFDA